MSSQKQPLVSIGIPTYNRPETLKRTLEGITQQTYRNLEIIVSDNNSSSSETEKIVREFMEVDKRIKYFRQQHNIGMFYNFRFVFQASRGEYFSWAADDDDRSLDFIESCINTFNKEEDSQLILVNSFSELIDPVLGKVLALDRGCTTLGLSPYERYRRYIDSIFKEQAWIGDLIYGVIKRSAVEKAFSSQPNILGWDHIFLANLALQGEFYTIPQPMMRSSPGGMSTTDDHRMAQIQLIEGSLSQKKRGWVRELYLQRMIRNENQLSLAEKFSLSLWSYQHYLKIRGIKNFTRSLSPEIYEAFKISFGKRKSDFMGQYIIQEKNNRSQEIKNTQIESSERTPPYSMPKNSVLN